MIKEKVEEINQTEQDALGIVHRAREAANESIRKANYRAEEIVGSIHRKRKEIIKLRIDESETRGKRKVKEVEEQASLKAARTEKDARRYLGEAVTRVFERIIKHGD